jgi:hypothetical protein
MSKNLTIKIFQLFVLLSFASLMACHGASSNPTTAQKQILPDKETPEEITTPPAKTLEDLNAEEKSDDQYNKDVLDSLDGTRGIPFFVMTYATTGNSDISVIRQKIRQADYASNLSDDLNRERQFISYPYTVDTYVISINSREQFKQLIDTSVRYPAVTVVVIPIRTMKVRSFLKVKYSTPVIGVAPDKILMIGQSYPIRIDSNFSHYNLEDLSTYLPYFESCRSITAGCFNSLVQEGYFKQDAVIDGNHERPVQYLSTQLGDSAYLRSIGKNGSGNVTGNGVFHINYDRRVITNLSLKNELWVTGKSLTAVADPVLYKIAGDDGHPVVEKESDGSVSYMLPVLAFRAQISKVVRDDEGQMGVLTSELQDIMVNELTTLNNASL